MLYIIVSWKILINYKNSIKRQKLLCHIVYANLNTYYMPIFHVILFFYMFNNSLVSN
jgi:hypothetical protein